MVFATSINAAQTSEKRLSAGRLQQHQHHHHLTIQTQQQQQQQQQYQQYKTQKPTTI
jgi:hypothetical protein